MKIIAEIGPAKGDLDYALACVDAAHAAGAWAVKGQFYSADTLVRPGTPRYDKLGGELDDQHTMFTNTLTYEEWRSVKAHADDIGIEFFASVFDFQALDQLVDMGCRYVKIASADITYIKLIQAVADTNLHVIISTGASNPFEILDAAAVLHQSVATFMACSLIYPCPPNLANLRRISTLRSVVPKRPVGYSDHTRGTHTVPMAVALGASVLEKHFTISPGDGYDHDFAVDPEGLKHMVELAASASSLMGNGIIGVMEEEKEARSLARRGLYWRQSLPEGQKVTMEDFIALRPSHDGVQPEAWLASGRKSGVLGRGVSLGDPVVRADFRT